mmetsp:Transcript_68044/g.113134  ORF Transcript_68044/g.113134 Transcript_68044/m.113134 type:complete len:313 (-) Transcript_68044:325-1263(-)|eukprot:CAMPEP_0119338034 /NCGR_PEP_ID=MMETSP1333-20130426/95207_1 /TAXON_ID=418940 /ORGANISM="Scyphosphaera apsteinii, Strain RCC1455" /LENGTH=312 /DNA_ID=CAMNT_0007349217 /DNA_START=94 /DNA_END=1032 /DNA_ORIENTATION=+
MSGLGLVHVRSATPDMPRLLFQYGSPRSGTTFQSTMLCVAALLALAKDPRSLSYDACCVWPATTRAPPINFTLPDGHIGVVKLHAKPNAPGQSAWIFATAKTREEEGSIKALVRSLDVARPDIRVRLQMVQFTADLAQRGATLALRYQEIFGLSQSETNVLLVFMRYWSILRQCCGPQMSASWRAVLVGAPHNATQQGKFANADEDSPAHAACEIYSLDDVEMRYLATEVVRKYGSVLPSLVGCFNGSYCRRYSALVAAKGLRFNENRSAECTSRRDGVGREGEGHRSSEARKSEGSGRAAQRLSVKGHQKH